jgi:hypothetical protein
MPTSTLARSDHDAEDLRQIKTRYETQDRGKGETGGPFIDPLVRRCDLPIPWWRHRGDAVHPHPQHQGKVPRVFRRPGARLADDSIMSACSCDGNTIAVVCECAWKHRHAGKTVHSPKLDIMRMKGGKMQDSSTFSIRIRPMQPACRTAPSTCAVRSRSINGTRTVTG